MMEVQVILEKKREENMICFARVVVTWGDDITPAGQLPASPGTPEQPKIVG
jgi:hypothetical protein